MNQRKGIGGHQSARMRTDEWITPPHILSRLGDFDLDPCSPISRPWDTAKTHYTVYDDGLRKEWIGRVWLNPPYGTSTDRWIKKLASHGNGIALIFARTETDMFFQSVWYNATALLFIKGRLYFYTVEGKRASANSGAPSVLIAYNAENADILFKSNIPGRFLYIN